MGNPQPQRNVASINYVPNVLQIALGVALYVLGGQESGALNSPLFLAWAAVWLSGVGLVIFGFVQIGKKRARARR